MALKVNVPAAKTSIGVGAPEAYAKISSYEYDARSNHFEVRVDVYYNEAARKGNARPVTVFRTEAKLGSGSLQVDVPSSGTRAQIYTWLKTQPYFSGSTNV